ncbi:MAG TPA: carboxypeptidase-like regulatory domain-containing protein [Chthoniobacterales bacterium]|jgi:hypothetical protein
MNVSAEIPAQDPGDLVLTSSLFIEVAAGITGYATPHCEYVRLNLINVRPAQLRDSRKKITITAFMSIRHLFIALVLLSLVVSGRAFAGEGLAIRGSVKGSDSKPLSGAEVRAQRLDGKGPVSVAKTDAKGEYAFRGLTLAAYKITMVLNKVPKAVASINTRATGWVRADFDLGAAASKNGAGHKRMIWVAGETGTHIGGGHWETVNDTNTGKGASSMERVDGTVLTTPGNVLSPASAGSGPSH